MKNTKTKLTYSLIKEIFKAYLKTKRGDKHGSI